MNLEKRIRALEAQFHTGPVILYLADGSTRELRGQRYFLLDLFVGACGGGDLSAGQVAQLGLIRQSVAAREPGGARMVEVVRCVLAAALESAAAASSEQRA